MQRTITFPDTFTFVSGDMTFEVPTADIPDASIIRLAMYGRRMFNDSVNGAVHAAKDKPHAERPSHESVATDWLKRLTEGTLGDGRGGAARLSDMEKELRTLVQSFLVNDCGYKVGQATKLMSQGAETVFRSVVAKELGAGGAAATDAWTKVEAHAKKILASRPSLDLTDLISVNTSI